MLTLVLSVRLSYIPNRQLFTVRICVCEDMSVKRNKVQFTLLVKLCICPPIDKKSLV